MRYKNMMRKDSGGTIEIENLKLGEGNVCPYCIEISPMIDIVCLKSKIEYQKDLTNWLYLNSPIRVGDHIIIANSKKFDFPFDDGSGIISSIIKEQGLANSIYCNKHEKTKVIVAIQGFLYDRLFEKLGLYPNYMLIALLVCLEYNRYISFSLIVWLKQHEKGEFEKGQDSFVNILLETFDMQVQFGKYNKTSDFDKLYVDFESLIAADKLSIEYGIEVICSRYLKTGQILYVGKDVDISIIEILCLLRAIHMSNMIKISYTEGEYKEQPLVLSLSGEIIQDKKYNNIEEIFLRDMKGQKSTVFEKYQDQVDEVVREVFGFRLKNITKVLDNIEEKRLLGDEFLGGDRISWCKALEKLGECDFQTAECIFDYFLLELSAIDIFNNKSRRNNRITRKPVIMTKEFALSLVALFIEALIFFIVDIYEGNIENKVLSKKLKKIYKQIDLDFEKEVLNTLKSKFPEAYIKGNLIETDLLRNMDMAEFPGQIDIIMLLRNILFVIECKNFSFKTDIRSRANEYSRLTKSNPKSIQGKLNKKVIWIKSKKKEILKILGCEYDGLQEYPVIGVITTRNFSIVSMEEYLDYPVVTWTRLGQWIEEKI